MTVKSGISNDFVLYYIYTWISFPNAHYITSSNHSQPKLLDKLTSNFHINRMICLRLRRKRGDEAVSLGDVQAK